VELDCYLQEREKRQGGPIAISGYNPAGYELATAMEYICALKSGHPVFMREYNKLTGKREMLRRVDPAQILIVEGSMAFQNEFPS
jgi:uridine kinase